jgi:membrane associated rhomboid family serine protease/antitoxin component YwqK of YwqJK toxin-antitoxin module
MNFFKKFPATVSLVIINVVVFIITYLQINTFSEPEWSLHLLKQGAEFNPYTLDGQWHRIFTHMFLHGTVLHILFNMYALYSVGIEVESDVSSKKFLWIYFISGVGAALVSLYWSLFTIGVGASGAIFGLFGFSLIRNLFRSRQLGQSVTPIVINFAIFLGINLYFAQSFKADTAAHLGGVACGMIVGIFATIGNDWFWRMKVQYAFIPVFVILYFALPRYQVTYFKFFQFVLKAEAAGQKIFTMQSASDQDYLIAFRNNYARWDTALQMLNAHKYLPEVLHSDTFKLRQYIKLRKQENSYRIKMTERESYIYLDSIEVAQDSMRHFSSIDYPLTMTRETPETQTSKRSQASLQPKKVYYNEEWEEVSTAPFAFYRIGTQDSLGRWEGRLTDFYANGDIQMKGMYTKDERNGIFIYYSDHKTYESAGRYKDDKTVGKWETYHANGKLESEVFYSNRYFLKNLSDSAGNQQVSNGNGRVADHHSNGVVAEEGEYRDGVREGYWRGRHANGELYFEENYSHGRLVNGRSRNLNGETFIYDASSFFPLPEGGYAKLNSYLLAAPKKLDLKMTGSVRLSFRVTDKGNLTDFKTLRSVSKDADNLAKEILKAGPRWIPAKLHGNEKVDGFAFVDIEFK